MHRSIKYRLFRSFAILVVIPTLIVILTINYFYFLNTRLTITNQGNAVAAEIETSLLDQFARYESLLDFIEHDAMVVGFAEDQGTTLTHTENEGDLIRLLQGYANSIEGIDSITILYTNQYLVNSAYQFNELNALNSPAISIDSEWYQTCAINPEKMQIFNYQSGQNPMLSEKPHYTSSLSFCKMLRDTHGHPVAVANITVRGDFLGKFLTSVYSQQGGQSYLVTTDQLLVNSPLHLSQITSLNNPQYHVTRRAIQGLPLTIINVLPLRPYNSSQLTFILLGIFSTFAFMVLYFVHARYTSKQFLQPIDDLRKLMQEAQKGNLKVSFDPHTHDEFEELAMSFNLMVSEIRDLISQVYVEQSNKRKAEIAALRAHIKPHFLYNTLDTIHWMARRRENDKIVEAVDALSDLFRVGFSSDHELGTVRKEFTHIESYLKIQKLRYEDILDYELIIDPLATDLPLQMTILQPIVENALYHGIKESGRKGKITISAYVANKELNLCVHDNGQGMSQEMLETIRLRLVSPSEESPNHGIGLMNVQMRLNLSYGGSYGLSIESRLSEGTTVCIHHPILNQTTPGVT
ncbi:MAG: sensor histidine kinase [Eubacteriales bacterium]|nr:sensor histidine kinase [Eubacteriales bacterium]